MKRAFVATLAIVVLFAGNGALGDKPGASEYQPDVKVKPLLKTVTTSLGQSITYPSTPEVTALEVEIAPGKETGWHQHPVPGYGYILSGSVVIEVQGGEQFRYEAGEAFVEVINTPHNGKNVGTGPVKILVFFSGEAGKPYTVRTSKQ
ncbi:MAG: cupin domain-containing protein [Pseudomonadota bacterium]|nr:cupin domain-containing protein [Pseudomonadota bacterium]